MRRKVSRREFLKGAAAGIGICSASALPLDALAAPVQRKSRVVIASSPNVFADPETNPNTIEKLGLAAAGAWDTSIDQLVLNSMLGQALQKFTGMRADAAWKSLFKPSDVVGIKVNCLYGKGASTRPEVVAAVVAGLKVAGVKEGNIIVWDSKDADLIKGGYRINRDGPGVKCYGTQDDYEETPTTVGQFSGRLSKILTQQITALVNVPILKDHGTSGITCAMKNHYGSHHNPGDHHANNCDPYIAELNSIPAIRNKTRLIVCEALKPLADGGPAMKRKCLWDYCSLMVGADPVALDYQGWQIIEARRKEIGMKSLTESHREPKWIATAASLGVGVNDPARIEVIRKVMSA